MFLGGLLSAFTTTVFPFLFIFPMLFEKLGSSQKQYRANIVVFAVLTVLILFGLVLQIIISEDQLGFNENLWMYLVHGSQIIFSIWFVLISVNRFSIKNNSITYQIFRWLGLTLFSVHLAFASLANIGPLVGMALVANQSNDDTINHYSFLLPFALGLITPFVIQFWFFIKRYEKLSRNKWYSRIQIAVVIYLLVTSLMKITILN